MTGNFELVFRALLKEVIEEVVNELSTKERLSANSYSRESTKSEERLLLTSHEAAERLAISVPHLERMKRSGILPYVRVGKCVRFSVEAIQQWIRCAESKDAPSGKSVKSTAKQITKTKAPPVNLPTVKQPTNEQTQGTAKLETRNRPKKQASSSGIRTVSKKVEKEDRRTPFSDLLAEIGIERSSLPSFTNGELMKIAEVDHIMFHGWMYLNRQLPEEAQKKLKSHFRAYVMQNGDSNDDR